MSGRGAAATVHAQAKVNLFLHILAREESGYHQIETLFCRVMLGDTVTVRTTRGTWAIETEGADTGPPAENLASRAARLYAEERGWPAGCEIRIEKRIPVGGGLGGGSADAGAVLRALAALDPSAPTPAEVLRLAGRLGADVPFLASREPLALGGGRGERLLALPPLPPRAVALLVPPFSVATKDAYAWLADIRATDAARNTGAAVRLTSVTALAQWETLAPLMSNDFESVVATRHPEIAALTAALRAAPSTCAALMSGSGSTVFAVLAGPPGAPSPGSPPLGSLADAAPLPGTLIMTATADHVAEVRRIE